MEAYALDLLGWGFTDNGQRLGGQAGCAVSPQTKRQHLYAFWQQVLGGRKMVLCGASLGGAIAIDFAQVRAPQMPGRPYLDRAGVPRSIR